MGKEEGILWVAVLATKLIHLPDKPAGVAQIGSQTVEVDPCFVCVSSVAVKRGTTNALGNVVCPFFVPS